MSGSLRRCGFRPGAGRWVGLIADVCWGAARTRPGCPGLFQPVPQGRPHHAWVHWSRRRCIHRVTGGRSTAAGWLPAIVVAVGLIQARAIARQQAWTTRRGEVELACLFDEELVCCTASAPNRDGVSPRGSAHPCHRRIVLRRCRPPGVDRHCPAAVPGLCDTTHLVDFQAVRHELRMSSLAAMQDAEGCTLIRGHKRTRHVAGFKYCTWR